MRNHKFFSFKAKVKKDRKKKIRINKIPINVTWFVKAIISESAINSRYLFLNLFPEKSLIMVKIARLMKKRNKDSVWALVPKKTTREDVPYKKETKTDR